MNDLGSLVVDGAGCKVAAGSFRAEVLGGVPLREEEVQPMS